MAYSDENNFYHSVGLRNVGSYQVSGTPWVSGSTVLLNTSYFNNFDGTAAPNGERQIQFPYVTKSILIRNTAVTGTSGAKMIVHFVSSSTVGGVITPSTYHYITLLEGADLSLDLKVKEIYLTAQGDNQKYEILADLTNIPTSRMYALTGSGITG